jgi:hypothetical protein
MERPFTNSRPWINLIASDPRESERSSMQGMLKRLAGIFVFIPVMACATPVLDFSSGFAGSTSALNFNNAAAISGSRARITNGLTVQTGTVWSKNQVDIRKFNTQFTFQIGAGSGYEAGFTFTLQRAGNDVSGYIYESLGYDPISPSIGIKFDIWPSVNTTGLYLNGEFPGDDPPRSIDMASAGIDLHSGHRFTVSLTYDGTTLHQVVTDIDVGDPQNHTFTHDYTISIPATIGDDHAYAGFTGCTGGSGSVDDILTWTYSVTPSTYEVNFTAYPENLQVYPRNRVTNTATISVSGSEIIGGFTAAVLRVYRNGVQVGSDQIQSLTYNAGQASFSFNPTITAELAHYDVELLLRNSLNQLISIRRAQDVVAGDVLVIQGQSNAVAKNSDNPPDPNDTASAYVSPFIRTLGIESGLPLAGLSTTAWMVAKGDGTLGFDDISDIGQWGLVMANQIVTANSVPLAVINGGFGGQTIAFFQRNDANHLDPNTNYGRLFRRLQKAGVAGAVRTILFYQGESDANNGASHEAGFTALRSDWLEDYPSVEKLYVFQVRECPCGPVDRFNVDLRNRQRLFGNLPNLTVMSVTGLDGHEGCHFHFPNGYQNIGVNIARMLQRDLYGGPSLPNTDPPNPAYAVLTGANKNLIRIPLRNRTDTVTFDPGAKVDFLVTGTAVSVVSGTVTNGILDLTLSGNATGATGIVYTGHSGDGGINITGNWVKNANGIGLLSFIEPLVTDTTPPVITLVGANPITVGQGTTYIDPGATATDNIDGNISSSIVINTSAVNTNVPGNYIVTFNVSDIAGNVATQVTRTVHVSGAPTANPQSVTTNEDTAKAVTLTGSDPDNDPITFTVVTNPGHGVLSGTTPNLTYTPAANYNGSDSFTFKVNDGHGDSNIATVSITVNPVNDPPTANAQSVSTNQNTPLSITLTGSDVETLAANLSFTVTVPPVHGSLSGSAPNLMYTPTADYYGPDSFKFTVTDTGDGTSGALTSAQATVSITVNGPTIEIEQPAGFRLVDGVSTVDFGSIARDANNSHTFFINNIGGANLTGLAVSCDGTNAGEFVVTSPPVDPVPPGSGTSVTIKFTPTALGLRNAVMHIVSNDQTQSPFDIALTGTGITNLEAFRLQYFGSISNSGNGADTNDFDVDGIPNIVEFATGTNPTQGNAMPGQLTLNGNTLEFLYSQAKVAISDGLAFSVEWTEELTTPNWNNVGVTEVSLGEDDQLRYIKASVPVGTNGRRFIRLNVTAPALRPGTRARAR